MSNDKHYYIYVLLTENNTYYCGYTDDVNKRFEKHKQGIGAKYTKSHKPLKVVYSKEFKTKSEAMKAESKFKALRRFQKDDIIKGYLTLEEL